MSQATVTAMGAALSSITEPGRLRLAIPNKGRMLEPTIALLRDSGLDFEDGTRALVTRVGTFPLDILSVRTDDIAEFVADGVADLGITGTNLLHEADVDLPVHLELGLRPLPARGGRPQRQPCAGAAGPRGSAHRDQPPEQHASSVRGSGHRRRGRDHQRRGRGRAPPWARGRHRGPRVDRLDPGHERAALDRGAAVEPGHPGRSAAPRMPRRADLAAELVTMLGAVVAGRRVKYLMMNAPRSALEAIEDILPGLDSPSVIPLAHEDMVAVHAVVPSDQVHAILSRLRGAGASGILVVPVEKLLP